MKKNQRVNLMKRTNLFQIKDLDLDQDQMINKIEKNDFLYSHNVIN